MGPPLFLGDGGIFVLIVRAFTTLFYERDIRLDCNEMVRVPLEILASSQIGALNDVGYHFSVTIFARSI